jgi:hypothetical protein
MREAVSRRTPGVHGPAGTLRWTAPIRERLLCLAALQSLLAAVCLLELLRGFVHPSVDEVHQRLRDFARVEAVTFRALAARQSRAHLRPPCARR